MCREVWPPSYKPQVVQIFSIPQTIQYHRLPRTPGPLMGASSPTFCPSKSAVPCWDKIPFECQMSRSWQVALPHSSGTFLTPQGLLTHKQCLGDCTTHLFGGGRQVGKTEPRPRGERNAFLLWLISVPPSEGEAAASVSGSCSAIFCLQVFCLLSFPTWGTMVLKARVQSFCG